MIVGCLLPLTGNDYWVFRGQDYFKQLYFIVNLFLLILLIIHNRSVWIDQLTMLSLSLTILYCLFNLMPFTALVPVEIESIEKENAQEGELSILIYNVYQHNDKYDKLLNFVDTLKPDLMVLLETDDKWNKGLDSLKSEYPYQVKDIRSNTYGMMVLSRIEFTDDQIMYLVQDDVPSIHVHFNHQGHGVQLLALHPRPPIPSELLSAKPKDREVYKAAFRVNKTKGDDSFIVAGDLNDVAWSVATTRLKKITGLKDPRTGRGMYGTFPSFSPFMIPIDQVFCSSDFKIKDFKVLKDIGSDHHPMLIRLYLEGANDH